MAVDKQFDDECEKHEDKKHLNEVPEDDPGDGDDDGGSPKGGPGH